MNTHKSPMKKFIIVLVLALGIVSLSARGGYGGKKTDKTERPAEAHCIL